MPQWPPESLCFARFTPGDDLGWCVTWRAGGVRSSVEHRPHGKSLKITKNNQKSMKNQWKFMIFDDFHYFTYFTNTFSSPIQTTRTCADGHGGPTKRALRWWVSCHGVRGRSSESIGLMGNHQKCPKMTKYQWKSMKINENSWFLMIFNIYIFYKYVQLTNTDHPHMCGRRWRATKGALRWWVSCQRRPRTWERSGRRRMNVFVE